MRIFINEIFSALLASMNVKPKTGFCSNKLDALTPSLSVNDLLDSAMSNNYLESAAITPSQPLHSQYNEEIESELKPIIRTTRALSIPSCTLVSAESHSLNPHKQNQQHEHLKHISSEVRTSSPSSSASSESSTALSASSTRIFENILNMKPAVISSSAHNICTARGRGVVGVACTPQNTYHLQHGEKKQILKKIQSASEMSSSGGLSDDSVQDQPRNQRFRLFPSEVRFLVKILSAFKKVDLIVFYK